MLEHSLSCELLPRLPALLVGLLRGMAQVGNPYESGYDEFGDPYMAGPPEPEISVGMIVMGMVIGLGINVLFGFWGKSRAEDHNVNPWIGFALGFCLSWIGVALVPVFKTHRVINQRTAPQYQPQFSAPNPMYTAGAAWQPPPGPPQPYPPQQAYPQPQPHPQQQPYPPQAYPAPYPPQGVAPPPPPQPQMLTADAQGYVHCPACGARTKAGRKTCMSCGSQLPPVYDPNIR
ncbi:MAG: hypothetical protein M5U25_02590 [Planctomycetota bacterium]|nr:hypothetical protein [Planctomycetota bacterium]